MLTYRLPRCQDSDDMDRMEINLTWRRNQGEARLPESSQNGKQRGR